jgi:hypothetical protein
LSQAPLARYLRDGTLGVALPRPSAEWPEVVPK